MEISTKLRNYLMMVDIVTRQDGRALENYIHLHGLNYRELRERAESLGIDLDALEELLYDIS